MPAKKMKAKAKRMSAKVAGSPFSAPACDAKSAPPKKTAKKKK